MSKVTRVIWNELLPRSAVFSTAEVAKRARIALANASRDLARLEKDGMVTRIRRGLWAVPMHPDFSPYAVVPHLFTEQPGGYVSLLSALNLHGMIEQIPRALHVVTTSQRPKLRTPVGTYEFRRLAPNLFDGFGPYRGTANFDIATPREGAVRRPVPFSPQGPALRISSGARAAVRLRAPRARTLDCIDRSPPAANRGMEAVGEDRRSCVN